MSSTTGHVRMSESFDLRSRFFQAFVWLTAEALEGVEIHA
jgi:hypothetical protein